MMAELNMAFGSFKAAFDLVKGLNAAITEGKINEVRIELQSHLIDAQQALFAAQGAQATAAERIRDLEQQIVQLKNWEGEKERYELKAIDIGAFAYMPKPGMERGEPPHWLCAQCFDKGQRSLLQSQGRAAQARGPALIRWRCNRCQGELVVFPNAAPAIPR